LPIAQLSQHTTRGIAHMRIPVPKRTTEVGNGAWMTNFPQCAARCLANLRFGVIQCPKEGRPSAPVANQP